VSDYFVAKAAEQAHNRHLMRVTKSALKHTTSLLCSLFPSIIRKHLKRQQSTKSDSYVYAALYDKAHQPETLAELHVTLDPITTGFMEDLVLVIRVTFERLVFKVQTGLRSLSNFAVFSTSSYSLSELASKKAIRNFSYSVSSQIYSTLTRGFSALKRSVLIPFKVMYKNMDKRTMRDLISEAGFEHHQYDCQTEDGYIISLHRIVNRTSFNVVYFQHGVMDNAQTWIVHGKSHSSAYMASSMGYDVFLGNFRGIYPRKLATWKQGSNYWNYNIDHLAKYDLAAFMQ
jgi:hypothetical protein